MIDECASIAVIDPDSASRAILQGMLQAVGLCVETFASTGQYLQAGRSRSVNCIVMDIQPDGLAFQARLINAGNPPPIVFITSHPDVQMSVRAIKGGAVEYLVRPVQRTELLEAAKSGVAHNLARLAERKALTDLKDRFATLSPREREIMTLLSEGQQAKGIAGRLHICTHTARVHSNRVMSKIGARSIADLVRIADKLASPMNQSASRSTEARAVAHAAIQNRQCAGSLS